MFEPTTLPTAMPGEPVSAAWTEMKSSGADVPNATTVRPMTSGGDAQVLRQSDGTLDQIVAGDDQQRETARENAADR